MVVVNASAGPSVISPPTRTSSGTGSLAMSSRASFCQKQNDIATTSTAMQMMIRVRSSSRCSTSVRRSSWPTALTRAMERGSASLLGDYLALEGVVRSGVRPLARALELADLLVIVVVVLAVAADRAAELADAAPHRASQLGQALGPEDDERDDQDDDQFEWSDIGHWVNGNGGGGRSDQREGD